MLFTSLSLIILAIAILAFTAFSMLTDNLIAVRIPRRSKQSIACSSFLGVSRIFPQFAMWHLLDWMKANTDIATLLESASTQNRAVMVLLIVTNGDNSHYRLSVHIPLSIIVVLDGIWNLRVLERRFQTGLIRSHASFGWRYSCINKLRVWNVLSEIYSDRAKIAFNSSTFQPWKVELWGRLFTRRLGCFPEGSKQIIMMKRYANLCKCCFYLA